MRRGRFGDQADAVVAEIRAVTAGYCTDPGEWRAICGQRSVDCSITPICRGARCVIGNLAACAERTLEDCEFDADCQLLPAFPFDATAQCFSREQVDVACVDADEICLPQPFLDGEGRCWLSGSCLPPAAVAVPAGHPCLDAPGTCTD